MPNNDISGSLPGEWGGAGWPNLQILSLYNNSIAGTIPTAWSRAGTFPGMRSTGIGV